MQDLLATRLASGLKIDLSPKNAIWHKKLNCLTDCVVQFIPGQCNHVYVCKIQYVLLDYIISVVGYTD